MSGARLLRALVAFTLVVGLGACGDDDSATTGSTTTTTTGRPGTSEPAPTEPASEEPASADGPYTVTVEDAGQEPRRALRLEVAPGDTDRVTQRQETTIELSVGGEVQSAPSPVTELDTTLTVEEVTDDRITATGTYDDVRVLDTPGADPATATQVRELLAGFLDATARTTYTTRGAVIEARIDDLELTGPGAELAEQIASGITGAAESLSVPFPEESVGVGARWRVDTEVVLAGLPVQVTTTVTLTELADDRAAATMEQRMRFVPGEVELLGTPVEVVSGELTGGGTMEWDLAGGLLPRSDVSISGPAVLMANGLRIEQFQEQRITITSR